MKKILTLLLLSLLPSLSFAGGDHGSHNEEEKALSAGTPGYSADVSRTVEVEMSDTMRFSPSQIKVEVGETIRFSVKNTGKLQHELVIGNTEKLKAHAQMMRKMPDMQHQEPNMVSLKGGQAGDIIWTFGQAGNVDFACLIPGHWEAGMKGKVEIK
ncbi:MAG: putative cupredoxin-like copper-binding protein [Psychromonas sp.]|jgi:uncharacterized cupredoxin-like copper-binding protein|uniref:cupredoxin domain-containing protein n=1 Tax=Psychromonas sp. TaxID=1884585 RepID=UPI0039E54A1A